MKPISELDLVLLALIAASYFKQLEAPKKDWIGFEQSAHLPQWEEPLEFHRLLN